MVEVHRRRRIETAVCKEMTTTITNTPLRCVLVGADTLAMECGQILLAAGHDIVAVVAGSERVSEWAGSRGLHVLDGSATAQQWAKALAGTPFDWLFAITHLAVLPDSVIALPERGSINFHDGPLPQYAGLNAPAWALMDGATSYGITWHLITSELDGGDVLRQVNFEIAPDETSLSLNTKNFAAAIESFEALVIELGEGRRSGVAQDRGVAGRTFSRHDRPAAMGMLDWLRPASHLDRLIRALDFGQHPNPLHLAWWWDGSAPVTVTAAEVADLSGDPGTILEIGDNRIVVACGEDSLAITAIVDEFGNSVTPTDVATSRSLRVGGSLPLLDDLEQHQLSEFGHILSLQERFHLGRLQRVTPVEFPWATPRPPASPVLHGELPIRIDSSVAGLDEAGVIAVFAIVLARSSAQQHFHVALSDPLVRGPVDAFQSRLIWPTVPMAVAMEPHDSFDAVHVSIRTEIDVLRTRGPFARDLVARHSELHLRRGSTGDDLLPIAVDLGDTDAPSRATIELCRRSGGWLLRFDRTCVNDLDAQTFVECLEQTALVAAAAPATAVSTLDILGRDLRTLLVDGWNATETPVPNSCVHDLFEAQADRTPDEVALVHRESSLTYSALDERANQLAHRLREHGVVPDQMVGIHVERSLDLVIAALAVLKAGAAYLPLDPTYPAERLAHMIADSGCTVVLTHRGSGHALPLADHSADVSVIGLDSERSQIEALPSQRQSSFNTTADLAYCIYTSGSTGTPKGVLIEHRNVVNFFTAMDDVVDHTLPATWLAVTSLSFDISVLELLYTLTRGFTVVVRDEWHQVVGDDASTQRHRHQSMDFSLFYFSGDEAENTGPDKYRLLLEGARWADDHDFCAVWTPERHFHAFGGLYPQPAITGAAVAAVTTRVAIRAGSVVLPLHHSIRVAEAWSIVDNLSNGRVGISVASGWQPNDFVLAPQNYATAKQTMFEQLEEVKRLWRGETVSFPGVDGTPIEITTLPRPVQPELPVWVTSAGNPETYEQAGRIGANVLTHLLGQSIDELAPKIATYRRARAEAGFDPDAGIVSLMLHTFVGDDPAVVRDTVREPLRQYLGTSLSLLRQYAGSFPTFRKPKHADDGWGDDEFAALTDEDRDVLLDQAFLRYYETSGLFGTPATCRAIVDRLKGIGVDEIACLIDFGVPTDTVLASLPSLDELRRLSNPTADSEFVDDAERSFASVVRRHGVTHLQCTPTMARLFSLDEQDRAALDVIEHYYIGGEAFPPALAATLRGAAPTAQITNMYGPTETTIWSTAWKLPADEAPSTVPIGTPIANTSVYILDSNGQLLPPGVPGALWIGGLGVARGYHRRPELTAERFIADPFRDDGSRMYYTGDVARWRTSGTDHVLEFLARVDNQVKIRGYRVELGEVEASLGHLRGVRECAATVVTGSQGEPMLVAYVASDDPHPDLVALRRQLRERLPDVMVPSHVVHLPALPHTPNGKIDRGALPWPIDGRRSSAAAPSSRPAATDVERALLELWHEVLDTDDIGIDDNFFDIGGHSLLVVRLHRRAREVVSSAVSLTDLYRYPTVRSLANALAQDAAPSGHHPGVDRAARRLEVRQRRTRS